jgi:hypothetical protein
MNWPCGKCPNMEGSDLFSLDGNQKKIAHLIARHPVDQIQIWSSGIYRLMISCEYQKVENYFKFKLVVYSLLLRLTIVKCLPCPNQRFWEDGHLVSDQTSGTTILNQMVKKALMVIWYRRASYLWPGPKAMIYWDADNYVEFFRLTSQTDETTSCTGWTATTSSTIWSMLNIRNCLISTDARYEWPLVNNCQ